MAVLVCPECKANSQPKQGVTVCSKKHPDRLFLPETIADKVGAAPHLGQKLTGSAGEYWLEDHIDSSPSAYIYRGRWVSKDSQVAATKPNPPVAVKIPNQDATTREQRKRIKREAEVLRKIKDPHTVGFYDFGDLYPERETGPPFIVMELLEGKNLASWLADRTCTVEEAQAILADVASSLKAAHEHGIIHRDIKPENIMITNPAGGKPQAKVIDFGIALPVDATRFTQRIEAICTPSWAAPEQKFDIGRPIGNHTDVFAVGLVLCKMLAGEQPTVKLVTDRNGREDIVVELGKTRQLLANAPLYWPVLEKALQPWPENRYQEIHELRKEFDRHVSFIHDFGDKISSAHRGRRDGFWKFTSVKPLEIKTNQLNRFTDETEASSGKLTRSSQVIGGLALLSLLVFLVPELLSLMNTNQYIGQDAGYANEVVRNKKHEYTSNIEPDDEQNATDRPDAPAGQINQTDNSISGCYDRTCLVTPLVIGHAANQLTSSIFLWSANTARNVLRGGYLPVFKDFRPRASIQEFASEVNRLQTNAAKNRKDDRSRAKRERPDLPIQKSPRIRDKKRDVRKPRGHIGVRKRRGTSVETLLEQMDAELKTCDCNDARKVFAELEKIGSSQVVGQAKSRLDQCKIVGPKFRCVDGRMEKK